MLGGESMSVKMGVFFLEQYESKKCVKNDTLYVKNDLLLIVFLLDYKPGELKMTYQFESYSIKGHLDACKVD